MSSFLNNGAMVSLPSEVYVFVVCIICDPIMLFWWFWSFVLKIGTMKVSITIDHEGLEGLKHSLMHAVVCLK